MIEKYLINIHCVFQNYIMKIICSLRNDGFIGSNSKWRWRSATCSTPKQPSLRNIRLGRMVLLRLFPNNVLNLRWSIIAHKWQQSHIPYKHWIHILFHLLIIMRLCNCQFLTQFIKLNAGNWNTCHIIYFVNYNGVESSCCFGHIKKKS